MTPLCVGLVGCGRISDIHQQNCKRFRGLEVVAGASLGRAETRTRATRYGVTRPDAPDAVPGPVARMAATTQRTSARETHARIIGFGRVQPCREKDINSHYHVESLAPETTDRPR